MPRNPHIPRPTVHAWSEEIGEQAHAHRSSLQRMIKGQRRLTRFIEENQAQMSGATGSVCIYLTSVIARMFDLAGGRLKTASWAQVREAEGRVQAHVADLLPLDDDITDRLHQITDRAQAHILDEAAMVLFEELERGEDEEDLAPVEAFKVLMVCWVITEVLDANWTPPGSFEGEATYAYHHIEPDLSHREDGDGDGDEG